MSNPTKTVSRKTFYLVISILLISIVASSSITFAVEQPFSHGYSLSVDIQPSMTDMSKGQTNTVTAYNLNGTAPYSYSWSVATSNNVSDTSTMKAFSSSNPASFLLNQTVGYITFKVVVTDAKGGFGIATKTITDTAALSTLTISGGSYPGAPAYTIFVESGTYYAKNQLGTVSSTSTSFSAVFNYAAATTGKIQLAEGTFIADAKLHSTNAVKIEGASSEDTVIQQGYNGDILEINGTSSGDRLYGPQISGINFVGEKGTYSLGSAITLNYVNNAVITNVQISSFSQNGIYANTCDGLTVETSSLSLNAIGLNATNSYGGNILNLRTMQNVGPGIYWSGSETYFSGFYLDRDQTGGTANSAQFVLVGDRNQVIGGTIDGGDLADTTSIGYGMRLVGTVNIISGVKFHNIAYGTYNPISIYITGSSNNTITSNMFDDQRPINGFRAQVYIENSVGTVVEDNNFMEVSYGTPVMEVGTSNYNQIGSNLVYEAYSSPSVLTVGSHTIASNMWNATYWINSGGYYEDQGTSTNLSNDDTITYYLPHTPSSILLTSSNATYGYAGRIGLSYYNVESTTFRVALTNVTSGQSMTGQTVSWLAIYRNPTAP